MEKQALKVDYGTVGRFGLGGAIAGGGTAALLNLVHMLREQRKEQKSRGEENTDQDTIVLNLPPKAASIVEKLAYNLTQKPMMSSKITKVDQKTKSGFRRPEGTKEGGQFDSTKVAAGWPTLTAATLAGMGGAGAGVALVDKLYQMRREKQLKEKLEAVQNDYMQALSGKKASAIDELFPIKQEKQAAGDSTFGMLNYPLAGAALLTLLGAGGTAYITKKILDEKLREAQGKGLDLPQVKRIVFKSAPAVAGHKDPEEIDGMKRASDDEMTSIKAAFFVMMDKLDTHTRVLDLPEVKKAQAAAGTSTPAMFNLSQGNISSIMDMLNKNPELARKIVQHGMAQRPIMKHFQWLANTSPGLSLGKHGIQHFLQGMAAPQAQPQAKIASIADTVAAMAAGRVLGSGAASAAKALLTPEIEQSEQSVNDAGKTRIDLSKLRVSAADPKAEAYLRANKEKVKALLKQMAAEGKI